MVSQPGTQTPTHQRSSSINGLPKGALNITIDGMNTQDKLLKSNDGFFSYIYPSQDSIEEITLSTSASGADSTSKGAAQQPDRHAVRHHQTEPRRGSRGRPDQEEQALLLHTAGML